MKKLRVLIIAEAANPDLTSVALIGHSLSQALAEVCDAHLVTESRNAGSLLDAGVPASAFTAIVNPAQSIAFHIATFLRGGTSLGWTVHSALTTLAYPLFERRVWQHFAQRLENGEFDLVHRITPLSPTTPSYLARKLANLGVPLVLGPLNGGIPWPAGFGQVRRAEREWLGYFRDLYRLLPGLTATRQTAAALVLASRHTYGEVTAKRPELENKAIWLPENAIDPVRFPEINIAPAAPVPGSPLRVAFLGRLVPYKGADMLLEAAAPLLVAGKMTLEIIGDGPQMPDLKAIVAREHLGDRVEFSGWVAHEQVRTHLAKAQLFAFPSVREFGGGVVLEAMALGLAPVVLDYGGPAELIPQGCGTIVPIGSREQIIAGFREVLTRLVEDPTAVHATGLRAQRHVRAHFTWAAKARQLLKIYA
ncbi:glycosyltransferase family 4 protein, partial [bacterium]|nr:glycosyltransferase family 4 protein [bacterium]